MGSLNSVCERFVLLTVLEEISWFGGTEQRLRSHVFLQGQQLMDLEHKLAVAKEELEKTALDKVSHSGGKKHP